jgi:hypothetical protein
LNPCGSRKYWKLATGNWKLGTSTALQSKPKPKNLPKSAPSADRFLFGFRPHPESSVAGVHAIPFTWHRGKVVAA